MEKTITTLEFEERLTSLCATAKGASFPRRQCDRHILLRSVIQSMDAVRTYSEDSLTTVLLVWLSDVGSGIDIDHATLRRYLVDEGYLFRNADGSVYRTVHAGKGQVTFEPSVADIDPARCIQDARLAIAARKIERTGQR